MSISSENRIVMTNITDVTSGEGGALHQLGLLSGFCEAGIECVMLTPKYSSTGNYPKQAIVTGDCSRLRIPASFNVFLQFIPLLICRLRGYNTLYARCTTFTWLLIAFARLLGMYVITEHNGWMSSERLVRKPEATLASRIDLFGQVRASKLSHKTRTVTEGIKRLLVKNGIPEDDVFCVGNGTNISEFKPLDEDMRQKWLPEISTDKIILGYLGGLVPWQGLDTLLEAFSLLEEKNNIHLVIAGGGVLENQLKQQAHKLGIDQDISFLGYVNPENSNEVMNSFDIALAPFTAKRNSEIGLSPIKIRNYAAAGLPIITADIEGIREEADPKWMRLHQPDNAKDLQRLLSDVLDDHIFIKDGAIISRSFAIKKYGWESITSRILELI